MQDFLNYLAIFLPACGIAALLHVLIGRLRKPVPDGPIYWFALIFGGGILVRLIKEVILT